MSKREFAESMLQMLTSSLLETAQEDRVFSEDEFYAIKNCYELAKPHISTSFERQWCGHGISWLNRDGVREDGELYDSFLDFMHIMIPDRPDGKDETDQ